MTTSAIKIKSQNNSSPILLPHYDASNREELSVRAQDLKKIQFIEKELRIVVLSTIGLVLCDKWNEINRMILQRKPNKDGHLALKDYSTNKKAVENCKTMKGRIAKFYNDLYKLQETINFHNKYKVEDPVEYWARQTETACKVFDGSLRKCLAGIYAIFRKSVKSNDPVMLSTVIKLVYMSGMYSNLLSSYAKLMTNEELKPFKVLNPVEPAFELSKNLLLEDEDGKILAFAYYEEEETIRDILRKKKFYLGHKVEEFKLVYPAHIFQCEDVTRLGYEIERFMYDFDTISKIRESAGLEHIDYKKIFKMDRDVPCCTTYPQYKICITMNRHEYARTLALLDDFEKEIPLYRGKKTDPVAGFMLNPKQGVGEPKIIFRGIWNSCGEASRETGETFLNIASVKRTNNCDSRTDKGEWAIHHNAIWISMKVLRRLLERLVESSNN